MKWKKRKNRENGSTEENFVALIQAAADDPKMKKQILAIAALDRFQRQSLLNTWISDLSLQGAPAQLITAIANLKDDRVAEKVIEVLSA